MKKIMIPAIFAAVLLVGMTFALIPIQQAATVHTTIKGNIDTKPAVFAYNFPLNASIPFIPLVPFVTNGYEGNVTVIVPRANLTFTRGTTNGLVVFAEDDGDRQPNAADILISVFPGNFAGLAIGRAHNVTTALPTGASGATTVDQIWIRSNLSGVLGAGSGSGQQALAVAMAGVDAITVILNLNITRAAS